MSSPFPTTWIHGAADCAANTDPPMQVFAFDANTFILRQNKCLNYEAPFMYLLCGQTKALLLDTGAHPVGGQPWPLRATVQQLLADWQQANPKAAPLELVVAHSHGHGDHAFGDAQFTGQPRTTVVSPTLAGVQAFFGFTTWPTQTVTFDLGGRPLMVLAIPGHEQSSLAFYDPPTGLLLSGDTVYPGFLYIADWDDYRASIARLAVFVAAHPVRYILGAHIEMTKTPGMPYPSGTTYQPNEHALELTPAQLAELHATVVRLGTTPVRTVLDDFILTP